MTEQELIKIYKVGRKLGYLPNSIELNSFVYDELINKTKYVDTWYLIYGTYSSSGILEFKFQNAKSKNFFTWQEVKYLMEDKTNNYYTKMYTSYLKNKRSKY